MKLVAELILKEKGLDYRTGTKFAITDVKIIENIKTEEFAKMALDSFSKMIVIPEEHRIDVYLEDDDSEKEDDEWEDLDQF